MPLLEDLQLMALRPFKLARIMGVKEAVRFAGQYARRKETIEFRIPELASPVYCRRSSSDIHVLWQVFGMRQYSFTLPASPRTIIDAGANVGYSSLFFSFTYPAARILAIEPETTNCEMFRRNCHRLPRISLFQAAVWPRKEDLRFQFTDVESWSFRVTPLEEEEAGSASSLAAITLPEVFSHFPGETIDLLKLDIEGTERALFESEPEAWLGSVSNLCIECHDAIYPGTTEKVTEVMTHSGFDLRLCNEEIMLFCRVQESWETDWQRSPE